MERVATHFRLQTCQERIAALDLAKRLDPYPDLTETAMTLAEGLGESLAAGGSAVCVNRAGSLFSVFFSGGPVRDFAAAGGADHDRYARFFHHMLDHGVWLPPSGYELWTLSTAHGAAEVDRVVTAARMFAG